MEIPASSKRMSLPNSMPSFVFQKRRISIAGANSNRSFKPTNILWYPVTLSLAYEGVRYSRTHAGRPEELRIRWREVAVVFRPIGNLAELFANTF